MNAGAKGISFINHIPSKTSLSGALMFSNLSLSLSAHQSCQRLNQNMSLMGGGRPLSTRGLCLACLKGGEGLLVSSDSLD